MCGRFIQISDPEKIKVGIPDLEIERGIREKFKQRFNIAPTQDILTILNMPTPRLTLLTGDSYHSVPGIRQSGAG